MNIRGKIILFTGVVALAAVLVAGVAWWAINETDNHRRRVDFTHAQLVTITTLALEASRYGEQATEMLVLGDVDRADLERARSAVGAAFDDLERLVDDEISFVSSSAEKAEERLEAQRLDRMRTLFRTIDASVEVLYALQEQDQADQAATFFRSQIRRPLRQGFQALITAALEDERAEAEAQDRRTVALSVRLRAVVLAAAALGVVLVAVGGLMLHRTLVRPVGRLTAGAAAIERGEFGYRIDVEGDDELARLARRFNAMAEQLEGQRRSLMAAQANLESEVRDRTERLVAANRRLEALDRLRTTFLADISHELRTPLTVLRGEAEVTLRGSGKGAAEYRETLERVLHQAKQMGRLVEDLLFVARAETDTLRFDMRRLDLRDVAADALHDGQVLASARGVRVALSAANRPITVEADPERLKQALMIGLANAINYAEAGSRVELAVRNGASEAEVAIENEGPGIPPEDLPYVFDRFYRARHGQEPAVEGSGLGLSIAKWIVEKHGGRVDLASPPGGRTTLTIMLPQTA